jgi:hypothetical protein
VGGDEPVVQAGLDDVQGPPRFVDVEHSLTSMRVLPFPASYPNPMASVRMSIQE